MTEGATGLLPREELAVDVIEAAVRLLGCTVAADTPEGTVAVRLVEVEAYRGADDPASHSFRGRTARNAVMFGPAGHLYVYFVYGMHFLLNVVTEREGHGSAVLFRGLEPVEGFARGARTDGPARLTRVLGIDKELNRWDLTLGERLWIASGPRVERIARGPRIGVDYAGAWAQAPLRFWEEGNPWVSR